MRYIYLLLILMFSYSSFATTCKDLLNKKFSWHEIDSMVRYKGERPIAKISPLEASLASKKAHKEMRDLISAGGEGHFGEVIYYKKNNVEVWSREEVVVVTTPPVEKIYGESFNEIYKNLQKTNTPVVVDPNTSWQSAAAVYTSLPYSDEATSILFMGPTRSDLVFRHEYLHVQDFATKTKEFLKEVPDMPQAIHNIVQKIMRI